MLKSKFYETLHCQSQCHYLQFQFPLHFHPSTFSDMERLAFFINLFHQKDKRALPENLRSLEIISVPRYM
jgi:hypothetical protein